jgi:hypothetical protein
MISPSISSRGECSRISDDSALEASSAAAISVNCSSFVDKSARFWS